MTPSMDLTESGKTQLLHKSFTQIGWKLIQDALASRALSPVTADRCHNLLPESDFASAELALQETSEMVFFLQSG